MIKDIPNVLKQTLRLLTFRNAHINVRNKKVAFLAVAFVTAWIAGLGRYWDHPDAEWWQCAGLGSVAYILILSALLWLIVYPLRPQRWNFWAVLIFVGLTSPLAWLYAVPVERFLPASTAIKINLGFLAFVAAWRVALYSVFLYRYANLRNIQIFMAVTAPLVLILFVLSIFNLEAVTFEVMAGIEDTRTAPVLTEAEIVESEVGGYFFMLGLLTFLISPIILILYIVAVLHAWWRSRTSQ